jgi:hypothetical protein
MPNAPSLRTGPRAASIAHLLVREVGPRMICTKCGMVGAVAEHEAKMISER